jgi:hypothetical protein
MMMMMMMKLHSVRPLDLYSYKTGQETAMIRPALKLRLLVQDASTLRLYLQVTGL